MLIAVVSDTHGIKEYMNKVRKLIKKADILIHLGDNIVDLEYLTENFNGQIHGVKGNCDFSGIYLREKIVEILGKKLFITHGDKYGVKYDLTSLYFRAQELGVDAALFGHTHQSIVVEQNNVWIINPGSPSLPRIGSRSIAFIEIEEEKPLYPYLVEI